MSAPASIRRGGVPPVSHWLMLGALAIVWGSAFAANEIALEAFGPATIVAGRMLIGAIVLLLWLYVSGRHLPSSFRQWKWFGAMAVVGNALPFSLIAWGQRGVDSGAAGILMAVMPVFVLGLAHWFVPGERIDRSKLIGFVGALAGVALLMAPDLSADLAPGGSLLAHAAILAGALCYAVNIVLARLAPEQDPAVSAAAVTLGAAVLVVPYAAFDLAQVAAASAGAVLAVVLLGTLATGLATVIYFKLARGAGAAFLSLINYLVPAWAVLVGWLFLGEHIGASELFALAIILASVLLSQRSPARRRVVRVLTLATARGERTG